MSLAGLGRDDLPHCAGMAALEGGAGVGIPGTAVRQTDLLARACRALTAGVGTGASCSYLLCTGAARASAHSAGEFHKSRERINNPKWVGSRLQERPIDSGPLGKERTRKVGGA